jgi:hypothetical protein
VEGHASAALDFFATPRLPPAAASPRTRERGRGGAGVEEEDPSEMVLNGPIGEAQLAILFLFWEIWIIPLKKISRFRYMPLQVNDMWGSHESMTCGVNGIYLNFGFFNGMHPIIPKCFCFCFYFYFF